MASRTTAKERPGDAAWRSRIVGHTEEDPAQLLANPRNWRTHPNRQRDALRGSLGTVGWVQSVIVNDVTGHLVDGHARIEEALSRGETAVPVTHVELTEAEEALVLATLDPIGAMATSNMATLGELLREVTVTDGGLRYLLEKIAPPSGDAYAMVIKTPVYEITGERPAVADLTDQAKAEELRAEIRAAELPEDVRDFLLAAAGRHVVFNYGLIAEWYAHAEPDVQRLMERSALVIVDYDNAIRDGFVKFQATLMELEAADRELRDE